MGQVRITARDRRLLGFAAEHRIVLSDHIQALLGISAKAADARLRALTLAGLLDRRTVAPRAHWITRDGLALVGSPFTPPSLHLPCYAHDVGVAWLWLAAHEGVFGRVATVIGERRLRSADARREPDQAPLAVRLGGFGAAGRERLHYPDLLLVDPWGRRIAVELELSGKGRRRLEGILSGYGADARIEAVVYLVTDRRLGRSIAASAQRLGLGSRACVRPVDLGIDVPLPEAGAGRYPQRVERGRTPDRVLVR